MIALQHTEALLMATAVALYLYDSAMLLYANEAVLMPAARQTWRAGFGSDKTTFRGKELLLPNPLLPARPVFRLAWDFERSVEAAGGDWTAARGVLARLAPPVWSLAVVMFAVLPLALFGRFGDLAVLAGFLLVYLNLLWLIASLWRGRVALGLSNRACMLVALDLLVCPPFAVNLIRRLALRFKVEEDFIHAAQRLLGREDWEAARAQVLSRLDDEISFEPQDTARMAALLRRRAALEAGGDACPAPKS